MTTTNTTTTTNPEPAVDPGWVAYQDLMGVPRGEGGKFAAADELLVGQELPATERAAENGNPPSAEPKATPEKASAAPQGERASRSDLEAFQGLAKRFKVPEALAKSALDLPKAELLAWTGELRKMQERFESAKAGDVAGAPKAEQAKPSQPAGTPKAEVGAPTSGEKGSDKRAKLAEALQRNGIDDEGVQAVLDLLGEPTKSEPDGALRAMAEQLRALQETQARTSLAEQFPGLEDDARYAKVRELVARWISSGDYPPDDVVGAMRDAAKIEFFNDRGTPKRRSTPRKDDGPTPPTGFADSETKDPEWDAYMRLSRGESPADIQRSRRT